MTFLPISFLRSRLFRKKDGITTLVIHCNRCTPQELEEYERMFQVHREAFVPYETYLRQPARKRFWGAGTAEYAMAAGKRLAAGLFRK